MNKERYRYHALKRRARRTKQRLGRELRVPRLAIFRSNAYTSAQIIDDVAGKTLAFASTRELKKEKEKKTKTEEATWVGAQIAAKAKTLGIARVVFDRRAYRYHGRVRALAEGARSAGLAI